MRLLITTEQKDEKHGLNVINIDTIKFRVNRDD